VAVSIELDDSTEQKLDIPVAVKEEHNLILQHGNVILVLSCCKTSSDETIKSVKPIETDPSDVNYLTEYKESFCMEWFDMILKSIGGSYKVNSININTTNSSVSHEVVFPCVFPCHR